MIQMDVKKIKTLLKHRYPFLLIDRVLEFEADTRLVALKNVSINEPFFQGHFPDLPVMPGVLIIEAMAQATGLLAMESNPETAGDNSIYLFVGIDKARFKRQVIPGDQLIIEADLKSMRRGMGVYTCVAKVGDEVAVTAQIMCAAREIDA